MASDDDFHRDALELAKQAYDAWDHNFELMDEDIDFLHGDHWPEQVQKERGDDRPMLTFNRGPSIVDQIVGDQRKQRAGIQVIAANGAAGAKFSNIDGTANYTRAQIYEHIVRNIEYQSSADMAYDTAFEHCAGHGLGYFRIVAEYSPDSFDQELRILPIRNYRSVLLDPDYEKPDGSDVRHGFIYSKLKKKVFEERYPDMEAQSIDMLDADQQPLWADDDYIFIAEMYYLEEIDDVLLQLTDGRVVYMSDVKEVLDELKEQGIGIHRDRKVKRDETKWCKLFGGGILEGRKDTVFSHIPIIPVFGKELVVKGTPYYRGIMRHAKDAFRMYNYSRTADIERTALVPKAPYIAADKQILPYLEEWESANIDNKSVLLYRHIPNVPPPQRQSPVSTNPGETTQAMLAADDIKSTTGMFDPSLGNLANAQSGRQELILQNRGDRGNYAFGDNMIRAIRLGGRVLTAAIPKVMDGTQEVLLMLPSGKYDRVMINQPIIDTATGKKILVNDLRVGKFAIAAKSGPSYATMRMEAAEMITEFIRALGGSDPITAKALTLMVARNSDWPEADDLVEIIKKSMPPGLMQDPGEPPPPPPQPSPADIANIKAAEAKTARAQADIVKAGATVKQAQADSLTAEVQLQQLAANMMQMRQDMMMQAKNIEAIVTQAIAQTLTQMQVPPPMASSPMGAPPGAMIGPNSP